MNLFAPKDSVEKEDTVPLLYPLSYGQQALWLLHEMAPESLAYNIFVAVKIYSPIKMEAFHRAWKQIVQQHSILRTTLYISGRNSCSTNSCSRESGYPIS